MAKTGWNGKGRGDFSPGARDHGEGEAREERLLQALQGHGITLSWEAAGPRAAGGGDMSYSRGFTVCSQQGSPQRTAPRPLLSSGSLSRDTSPLPALGALAQALATSAAFTHTGIISADGSGLRLRTCRRGRASRLAAGLQAPGALPRAPAAGFPESCRHAQITRLFRRCCCLREIKNASEASFLRHH